MKFYTILTLLLLINVVNAQNKIDHQKINDLYYNMNDYDFKGFSADIKLAIIDQLKSLVKDEKYLKVLNNLELKLDYYGRDSVNYYVINLIETDNKQFDLG